jgi:hypothetical protein
VGAEPFRLVDGRYVVGSGEERATGVSVHRIAGDQSSGRLALRSLCNLPAKSWRPTRALRNRSACFQVFIAVPNFDSKNLRCRRTATIDNALRQLFADNVADGVWHITCWSVSKGRKVISA